MRLFFALLAGLLFGSGIALSGMINPAKVLNFFDVAGSWDPSLAFVMGGAVIVTFIGYRLAWRRKTPFLADGFQLPAENSIDCQLLAGSAIFGIGWGIAGFCPGGSLPALGLGQGDAVLFVTAMIGGILVARSVKTRLSRS
ncbi:YeeE/YedE family protein [Roseibium sp. CAU 1637]|uniref:YeeE/YedE family protein n=1 Tax=Roseibium limicola TaxID=2816037 RepID=A0A939ESC0_9HYPH|nr:DUF6691 family protein [Roseibium limicola]MBO0346219.1 YeeE/YedE family protein [Roseibium limicola]